MGLTFWGYGIVVCLWYGDLGMLQRKRERREREREREVERILFQSFTSAQKQCVISWKRSARKYTPMDLRRQRVITPHTGKCDSCQKVSEVSKLEMVDITKGWVTVVPLEFSHRDLFGLSKGPC